MPKIFDAVVFFMAIAAILLFFLAITGSTFGFDSSDKMSFLFYSVMFALSAMFLQILVFKGKVK